MKKTVSFLVLIVCLQTGAMDYYCDPINGCGAPSGDPFGRQTGRPQAFSEDSSTLPLETVTVYGERLSREVTSWDPTFRDYREIELEYLLNLLDRIYGYQPVYYGYPTEGRRESENVEDRRGIKTNEQILAEEMCRKANGDANVAKSRLPDFCRKLPGQTINGYSSCLSIMKVMIDQACGNK